VSPFASTPVRTGVSYALAGDEPFEEKMQRLTGQWRNQVTEAQQLDMAVI